MATYDYTPHGVCARKITFDIVDGKLHDVGFVGGCNGNLKAIGLLLEGKDPKEAISLLKGNENLNRIISGMADAMRSGFDIGGKKMYLSSFGINTQAFTNEF